MTKAPSLLLNAGLTGGAQALGRFVRFLVASLAIGYFGTASWGEVAYALAMATYVNFILDFGVSSLALIDRPDDVAYDRKLFVALSYARLMMIVPLGLLALWAFSQVQIQGGFVLQLYLLLSLSKPFNMDWWLQRKGYAGVMPVVQLMRQLLVLCYLLWCRPQSIHQLVLVDVGLEFLAAGASWVWGPRREFSVKWPQRSEWVSTLACYKDSFGLFVASSLLLLHQNVDLFFIRRFHGLGGVGVYEYGNRFVLVAFMAGGSLSVPLRRQLARLREQGAQTQIEVLLGASHRVLGLLSLGFLFFALYISPWILSLNLSAQNSAIAWQIMVILAVWLVVAFYSVPFGEWLVTEHRKLYLYLALIAGGANVLANGLLVPHWGVQGAAWAKVCSEVAILSFLLWHVPRYLKSGFYRAAWPHGFMLPALMAHFYGYSIPIWGWSLMALAFLIILWKTGYVSRNVLSILKHN